MSARPITRAGRPQREQDEAEEKEDEEEETEASRMTCRTSLLTQGDRFRPWLSLLVLLLPVRNPYCRLPTLCKSAAERRAWVRADLQESELVGHRRLLARLPAGSGRLLLGGGGGWFLRQRRARRRCGPSPGAAGSTSNRASTIRSPLRALHLDRPTGLSWRTACRLGIQRTLDRPVQAWPRAPRLPNWRFPRKGRAASPHARRSKEHSAIACRRHAARSSSWPAS